MVLPDFPDNSCCCLSSSITLKHAVSSLCLVLVLRKKVKMPGDDTESRGGRVERNSWNNKNTSDSQWTLWLVPLFVVANIVVFVGIMYVNNCPEHRHTRLAGKCVARFLRRFSFEPLRENHLFGPSSSTLDKLGGLEWTKVVINHQGWRLITCMWLHAGVIHLLANMLGLLVIGICIEQQFGFDMFLLLFELYLTACSYLLCNTLN
ncbi:hypothetical protein F3Y22_tig00116971pilonHSYRG00780 [Hibiscus syriacus]|uniref:RHOMBOID-like protein n=1 Tax=Hibiscus syriacus TaxID=106335 RepID=A0A6A2WHD5_HIBSY|nr:hypothetical protein F3Y22_tig00116971pilonHSYRG00780 [Hibiscus syriacus]